MADEGHEIEIRTPESRQLSVAAMTDGELTRTIKIAGDLAKSGVFKDVRSAHQAFAKMLIGRDLGISPTQAMMGLDFVKGNIQMRGTLLAAFVRKSSDYDYRIISLDAEMEPEDDQHCTLRFFKRDFASLQLEQLEPDITYTFAMAKRTGNVKDGSAWHTARRNMLLWRAMSDGVKFHCPDLLGGIPTYIEGEIPPAVDVTAGSGDGEEVDRDKLPEMVAEWAPSREAGVAISTLLARAHDLGHRGLADYDAAETALKGQPMEVVWTWVNEANDTLDAMPVDAEVVDPDPSPAPADVAAEYAMRNEDPEVRAAAMLARAQQIADQADEAEADDPERAEELRAEAVSIHDAAVALADDKQGEMDV